MRCQCINITNNLRCKNKTNSLTLFKYHNKYYCYYHIRYYSNKSIIIIQKIYRGYKSRRILDNIYKRLPWDAQCHILSYMKEKYYYNKYLSTIGNIVSKKIIKLNDDLTNAIYLTRYEDDNSFDTMISIINDENSLKTYKMYTKYHYVVKNNENLSNSINNLKYKLIMFNYNLYHSNYIDIYFNFNHFYQLMLHYVEPDMFISHDA